MIDKGCLCNSLFHYPVNMVFFTTPELLEIGDLAADQHHREAHAHGGAEVLPQMRRAL